MNKVNTKKKILVVMPKFPYPPTGACEQDRSSGLELFIKLGYEIRVIAKVTDREAKEVLGVSEKLGIQIFPVPYTFMKEESVLAKIARLFVRIINPLFWDGASYEYRDREIKKVFMRELDEFKPDLVWVEYTTLWPLYKYARNINIPIITRSINFEPTHFIEEDGLSFFNVFKFLSKFLGEIITIKKSDVMLAITPKEEKIYKKYKAKKTMTLPLRGLSRFLGYEVEIRDSKKLNVFFMGSTYNVSHNRKALEMVVSKIAPLAEKTYPDSFTFHIMGAKLPLGFDKFFNDKIVYHGYVPKSDEFLSDMDIAIIPSLFGQGMQQKIFEPLARGIPTITSERGLAGYPFENEKHLLLADSTEDFVNMLGSIRDPKERERLSRNAKELSKEIFSAEKMEAVVGKSTRLALGKK